MADDDPEGTPAAQRASPAGPGPGVSLELWFDRACAKCGYNLRGLPIPGYVARCPECGTRNGLRRIIERHPRMLGLGQRLWFDYACKGCGANLCGRPIPDGVAHCPQCGLRNDLLSVLKPDAPSIDLLAQADFQAMVVAHLKRARGGTDAPAPVAYCLPYDCACRKCGVTLRGLRVYDGRYVQCVSCRRLVDLWERTP